MSATAPISLEWLNAKENKFSAYNISAETLALINKSETLKADIRAYAASTHVNPGEVSSKAGAGEYRTYVAATGSTLEIKGFLNIAADRFSTAESTFNILAHELGHFRIEEPGAAVANARANALAGNDKAAYESACNLTEGYAHYNEVKARDEVLASNRAQAAAENRPLTAQEQKLDDRWSGNGVFANLAEGKDHNTVKGIENAAGAYGQLLTPQDVVNAAAFALGEDNKSNTTSNTGQTYLAYCRDSANTVLSHGASPASAPVQEQLQTTYNADGTVATNSIIAVSQSGDQTSTVFDREGNTTQVTEIDGAHNNADYNSRVTTYDADGRTDSVTLYRDDGSRDWIDYDLTNASAANRWEQHFDAQGREDWLNTVMDDGSRHWVDYDQANIDVAARWEYRFDAQGRLDWYQGTLDDGGRHWVDYDQTNADPAARWEQWFDAQGRVDWYKGILDDGSQHWVDYDQANADPGARWERWFDPQGRQDWYQGFLDDGSRHWVDYDQTNADPAARWEQWFDPQGRLDWYQGILDDGSRHWVDYDQTNVDPAARWEQWFDPQGRQDWYQAILDDGSRYWVDYDQTNASAAARWEQWFDPYGREDWYQATLDDGSRNWIDYDQTGTQGWSSVQSHFDAWGREDYATMFLDDGSRNTFDYDQDGSQRWSRMESHFGANGRAEYSTTFNDDGSRLVIDHDYNGHLGEHAIITYSAAGRAHLVGWTRDGYDGLIFTPAGGVIGADGNASGPPSSFGQFPAALPYLPAIYSDSDGDGPSWTIETPFGDFHGT